MTHCSSTLVPGDQRCRYERHVRRRHLILTPYRAMGCKSMGAPPAGRGSTSAIKSDLAQNAELVARWSDFSIPLMRSFLRYQPAEAKQYGTNVRSCGTQIRGRSVWVEVEKIGTGG